MNFRGGWRVKEEMEGGLKGRGRGKEGGERA
jgi:hypothetical protein